MHVHMAARTMQTAPAEALLGHDHPLVRILERMTIRLEGMAVVAAILCGSVAALVAGDADARAVVIAAVAAEVVLAVSLGLLSDRHACVLGLMAAGRAGLPLRVVEREQRRLLARATAAPELEAVARLLVRGGGRVAGVAQIELLVLGNDSPLYGRDADRLRAELRRIAFTLAVAGEEEDAAHASAHC